MTEYQGPPRAMMNELMRRSNISSKLFIISQVARKNQNEIMRIELVRKHRDVTVHCAGAEIFRGTCMATALGIYFELLQLSESWEPAAPTQATSPAVDFRTSPHEHLYESDRQKERTPWNGVLSTFDWWELSQAAIKIYGAICMKCRADSFGPGSICVDHIQPRSMKPELARDIENLQILCERCNTRKGNREIVDYRPSNWKDLIHQRQPLQIYCSETKAIIPDVATLMLWLNEQFGRAVDQNEARRECNLARQICSDHHLFINNWMKKSGASFTTRDDRYRCYSNYLRKPARELEAVLRYKQGDALRYFGCHVGTTRRQLVDRLGGTASQTSLAYAVSRLDYDSLDFAVI